MNKPSILTKSNRKSLKYRNEVAPVPKSSSAMLQCLRRTRCIKAVVSSTSDMAAPSVISIIKRSQMSESADSRMPNHPESFMESTLMLIDRRMSGLLVNCCKAKRKMQRSSRLPRAVFSTNGIN